MSSEAIQSHQHIFLITLDQNDIMMLNNTIAFLSSRRIAWMQYSLFGSLRELDLKSDFDLGILTLTR